MTLLHHCTLVSCLIYYGRVVSIPWWSRKITSAIPVIPFSACYLSDTRNPEGPERKLIFKFNGMFIPPGRSTDCSGNKISWIAGNMVTGSGSRRLWGSQGPVVNGATHFPSFVPGPISPSYVRNGTLGAGSELTAFWRTLPNPASCCHLLYSLRQRVRNLVRPVTMTPLLTSSSGCEFLGQEQCCVERHARGHSILWAREW